jgi:hypothetical protein
VPGNGCGHSARLRSRSSTVYALCLALVAGPAAARPVRRVFQPEDLDFRESGLLELTLQFGLIRGQAAYRVSSPGFDLDLGLTRNLELDVSGEFAVAGPDEETFTFDRTSPDNTWTSLKAGLLDVAIGDADALTTGVQLGPQLPTARGNAGLGLEGLVLAGWRHGETLLMVNLGGLLDPRPGGGDPRPAGLEGGLDLSIPVDAAVRWTLYAGLSGVHYLATYQDQMNVLAGVIWSASGRLDVSLTVLGGPTGGGDRWGVLLGLTPRARLW